MNFPRNELEAWALPHFSGGDAEALAALMELDSKGDYRSDEMRAARDAWQQMAGHRDALAAHVERLKSLGSLLVRNIDGGGNMEDLFDLMEKWPEAIKGSPTTSLARRDAEQQAAAIDKWSTTIIQMAEWAARKHNEDPSFPPINLQLFRELCCDMDDDADRLRRQAEGGTDS